ncbi:MAG TPA: flagellar hook-associated protein FlgK [Caulobacteraceae bacterium]|jgi:flagellar hook-associated protein 1 FlgK
MAINSVMAAALSGLQTAQTGLTTVSNNITNVNTPGYAREVVQQAPLVAGGIGSGVTVIDVQRITNHFLEQASLSASSSAGSASIISNLLGQAQSAFGDPTQTSSYLNQLSTVFSDFAAAANDPASSLPRSQVIDDLTSFLDTTQTVAGSLAGLNTQADTQIGSDVGQINQLLSQIATLNTSITSAVAQGTDASASQDSQGQLISQLSSLMQVNVSTQPNGSVVVRSSVGQLLAGPGGSATLTYTPSVSGFSGVTVVQPADPQSSTLAVGNGELQGLLSLRNSQIPGIQAQLASYVQGSVTAINAAHNANSAVPPPQTLTGRNTGLDLTTAIGDFSGVTNVAVVDSGGNLLQQVSIDFGADTMSVNGNPATPFSASSFLTDLNTALGGQATASFSNGQLSLSATASGTGVAIQDDPTTPSRDGGQGFSQFFGLNDLITSNQITNFNTGLTATDDNGFTPGGQITFQIADASGTPQNTVTVTVPPAGTMQDLLDALNAPIGGVGQYGQFNLNSAGALSFTPNTPGGASIAVTADTTQRGTGGPSMTQLFGIGASTQAQVATAFQIRSDIAANPMNMALAQLDLSAAANNAPVLAIGDGSGATALSQAASAATSFAAAGSLPAQSTTVLQYAANLGGSLGQQAAAATSASSAAQAVQTEANTRLQSVEGVNLDEELVNMTTYQQAYNASARLIQASQSMLNTLLQMVQ